MQPQQLVHVLGLIKGLQPAYAARFLLCLDEKRCDDLLNRVKDSHRDSILNALAQGVKADG